MAKKDFVLNLGKLVISAAWADGQLQQEELNALKELLFCLPEISGEEWSQLEIYMVSPVSDAERQNLLNHVLHSIRTSEEKQLALETLKKLMPVDTTGSQTADMVLTNLTQDIEEKRTGLLSHLTEPIRQALHQRSSHYQGSREARLEDFIKNTVYFQLVSKLDTRNQPTQVPESHTRKICLAAGLMARVAWVDHEFCEHEQATMAKTLREQWNIPEQEATLITDIARARVMHGLDLLRLTLGFSECTTLDERKDFLRCLFALANAANKTSHEEIEEIRAIAKALALPHQEFIDAKLTIPREDRKGL